MKEKKWKPGAITLAPGKFYRAVDGGVWCVFRDNKAQGRYHQENSRFDAVSIINSNIEYFFADGRYDHAASREHCLVEECGPNGETLVELDVKKSLKRAVTR